jgi:RNA polymerase sigma-70 factor (sigma-E family)
VASQVNLDEARRKGGPPVEEFVRIRYPDLLRMAYLLAGSRHEAEDLVQSALLRMVRRWGSIDEPLAYARRTIVNLYLNSLRRRRRELVTALLPDRATRESTDRIAERSTFWPALAALPRRTRAVIVLRYWLDLPEAEVADVLGVSAGTVKSTASRGLARLRQTLATQSSTVDLPDARSAR